MTHSEFHQKALQFLLELERDLKTNNLYLHTHWHPDHLCYRVDSQERYQEMKTLLGGWGSQLLAETEVNGRPIASYLLTNPIPFGNHRIRVLELPAPKPSAPHEEGFEHMELVCDRTFQELQKMFPSPLWKTYGTKKSFNPELEFKMGKRNIKFHHQSLESVIQLEKNEPIWNALQKSRLLDLLAPFEPFPFLTANGCTLLLTLIDEAEINSALQALGALPLERKASDHWQGSIDIHGLRFTIQASTTPSIRQEAALRFRQVERDRET